MPSMKKQTLLQKRLAVSRKEGYLMERTFETYGELIEQFSDIAIESIQENRGKRQFFEILRLNRDNCRQLRDKLDCDVRIDIQNTLAKKGYLVLFKDYGIYAFDDIGKIYRNFLKFIETDVKNVAFIYLISLLVKVATLDITTWRFYAVILLGLIGVQTYNLLYASLSYYLQVNNFFKGGK